MDKATPYPIPMIYQSRNDKERILTTLLLGGQEPKNRKERKQLKKIKKQQQYDQSPFPYREAIGSLAYLANGTRPDITYAVNMLSRKQANPSRMDWENVKRIFRYLNGTRKMGLKYTSEKDGLIAYADASYGDDTDTKKSTTGFIIRLHGDIVAWSSKRQGNVSTSTCEAEYVALNAALQEAVATNATVKRATGKEYLPIELFGDNSSSLSCAEKPGVPSLRHIPDIKFHYILHAVINEQATIEWVSSKEQDADILTKPLTREPFQHLRSRIVTDITNEQTTT